MPEALPEEQKHPTIADSEPPRQFASVPPPELYATSDIRFVMLEIGKLTAKVDRLVDDVKGQGTKLDKLRLTVAWVGGAAAVVVFLLTIAAKIVPLPRLDLSPSPTSGQQPGKL